MAAVGGFIAGLMVGGFLGMLLVCLVVIGDMSDMHDKIMALRSQLDEAKNREVLGESFYSGGDE